MPPVTQKKLAVARAQVRSLEDWLVGGKALPLAAAAGAGAGTGVAAATGKSEAVIPAESVFTFTLTGSK